MPQAPSDHPVIRHRSKGRPDSGRTRSTRPDTDHIASGHVRSHDLERSVTRIGAVPDGPASGRAARLSGGLFAVHGARLRQDCSEGGLQPGGHFRAGVPRHRDRTLAALKCLIDTGGGGCGGSVASEGSGQLDSSSACRLRAGFLTNCLLAGVPRRGVARKRREHINPNQECPPRSHHQPGRQSE